MNAQDVRPSTPPGHTTLQLPFDTSSDSGSSCAADWQKVSRSRKNKKKCRKGQTTQPSQPAAVPMNSKASSTAAQKKAAVQPQNHAAVSNSAPSKPLHPSNVNSKVAPLHGHNNTVNNNTVKKTADLVHLTSEMHLWSLTRQQECSPQVLWPAPCRVGTTDQNLDYLNM